MDKDQYIYRNKSSKYYENNVDILGLDYYKKDSAGEDDFSRKQVWFYVYGDKDLENYFLDELTDLFELVISDSGTEFDLITVLPTHAKGEYNKNLAELTEKLSDNIGVEYDRFLHRTHQIRRNHDLESMKEKVINLENSVDVQRDVEGKNIVLVDNITLTGSSFMHIKDLLMNKGANKVICLCLGLDSRNKEDDLLFKPDNVSHIREKIGLGD